MQADGRFVAGKGKRERKTVPSGAREILITRSKRLEMFQTKLPWTCPRSNDADTGHYPYLFSPNGGLQLLAGNFSRHRTSLVDTRYTYARNFRQIKQSFMISGLTRLRCFLQLPSVSHGQLSETYRWRFAGKCLHPFRLCALEKRAAYSALFSKVLTLMVRRKLERVTSSSVSRLLRNFIPWDVNDATKQR